MGVEPREDEEGTSKYTECYKMQLYSVTRRAWKEAGRYKKTLAGRQRWMARAHCVEIKLEGMNRTFRKKVKMWLNEKGKIM